MGTSRLLEDLVADLMVCDAGVVVGSVVGEVREVDDVVGGGEDVDAEEEVFGKISAPPCGSHFFPRVRCHTGAFA